MIPDDINGAVCNSREDCAIARTINRQIPDIGRVRVSAAGVSIAKGGYRHYYKVPHPAARLVRDFDAGRPVKPISFNLLIADRRKIQPIDDARKKQVNEARRTATATLAALGEKPKRYPKGRYGI